MSEEKAPLILHLNNNHFVVMQNADDDKVLIKDPAKGVYKLDWDELNSIWSGYFMIFEFRNDVVSMNLHPMKDNCYALAGLIKENVGTIFTSFYL